MTLIIKEIWYHYTYQFGGEFRYNVFDSSSLIDLEPYNWRWLSRMDGVLYIKGIIHYFKVEERNSLGINEWIKPTNIYSLNYLERGKYSFLVICDLAGIYPAEF